MAQDQMSVISFPTVIVPPCFVSEPGVVENWRYEDHHRAQQLLDNLWIGPLASIRNEKFLLQHNIRLLISLVTNSSTTAVVRHRYPASTLIKYFAVDLGHETLNATHIVGELPRIIDAISYAAAQDYSALIFCETGNGPSAVAAAAYMIDQKRMSVTSAVQFVQSKRFSVLFSDTDLYNLGTFAALIRAKADAAQRQQVGGKTRIIRCREEVDDLDDCCRNIKRGARAK